MSKRKDRRRPEIMECGRRLALRHKHLEVKAREATNEGKSACVKKLIDRIESADSKTHPGLQAADFLAWHTNRDLWVRDAGKKDLMLRGRAIAAGLLCCDRYDYAKLVARYGKQAA